jgi:outer membrane lipoprotein-sorting protein
VNRPCGSRKLGQKMIDGVLCEGLETTDSAFGVANFQVDSLVARVWVSVETGYPVLLEAEVVGDNGQLRITGVLDEFQWDVELDPSIFQPKIPPDYTQI